MTSGKVVLASNATQVTNPTASNVLDFVGYGSADQYEGSEPAPSPTTLTSITRISGDTNDNTIDFTVATASPGTGTLAVSDIYESANKFNFIKNSFVKDNEIVFDVDVTNVKIYNSAGAILKTTSGRDISILDVSDLPKGNYIVTGTVNNQPVSQKILKD